MPLFAFLEACVGIGLFVTGVILLTISTVLYAEGIATILQIIPLAFLGALIGDHSGYLLGRWIGPRFHHTNFANKYSARIEKAEDLIRRRGSIAILIGRLLPAIRSIIPLITGISGFSRLRYFSYDVLACFIWSSLLGVLVVGIDSII